MQRLGKCRCVVVGLGLAWGLIAGHAAAQTQLERLEGIVRKLRKSNPRMAIVLVIIGAGYDYRGQGNREAAWTWQSRRRLAPAATGLWQPEQSLWRKLPDHHAPVNSLAELLPPLECSQH